MKSKKLNKKNIKLISAIALVIIMIIVLLFNILTNNNVDNLSKSYNLEYIETLYPGIKHDLILKKDGDIEVSSIIKSDVSVEVEPFITKIDFSEKNTINVKKFILSYFEDSMSEATVSGAAIHATKEQFLLESIVYNCEKCFELEYNKYENKIHYVLNKNRHYIYLLEDNKIMLATTSYDEKYNIMGLKSYEIDFSEKTNNDIVKLFEELFKDKKEKEQYVDSQLITKEQNDILLAIVNLNENYLYTPEEVENIDESVECVENCPVE